MSSVVDLIADPVKHTTALYLILLEMEYHTPLIVCIVCDYGYYSTIPQLHSHSKNFIVLWNGYICTFKFEQERNIMDSNTDNIQISTEMLIDELVDRIEEDSDIRHEIMDRLDIVDTTVETTERQPMRISNTD